VNKTQILQLKYNRQYIRRRSVAASSRVLVMSKLERAHGVERRAMDGTTDGVKWVRGRGRR